MGEDQQTTLVARGSSSLLPFYPSPHNDYWQQLCSKPILEDKTAEQCSTQAMNQLMRLISGTTSELASPSTAFTTYQNAYLCLQMFHPNEAPRGILEPLNIAKIHKTTERFDRKISPEKIMARYEFLRDLLSVKCPRRVIPVSYLLTVDVRC